MNTTKKMMKKSYAVKVIATAAKEIRVYKP
jgi:hypothetical protein